jgi:hypothetical protein
MPSWNALTEHLRARYDLQTDHPDELAMVWTYDDGRRQRLIIRRYTAFEREFVEFKSAFARKGDVAPEVLLQRNAELPLGMIAEAQGVYWLVYGALLDALPLAEADFYLARVAAIADTLEEGYGKRDQF